MEKVHILYFLRCKDYWITGTVIALYHIDYRTLSFLRLLRYMNQYEYFSNSIIVYLLKESER